MHSPRSLLVRRALSLGAVLALALGAPAYAQDDPPGTNAPTTRPPSIDGASTILLDGEYKIRDLVEYFARVLGENYILEGGDKSLNEEVSIISHQPVSPRVAEAAFHSALEIAGYTVIDVGSSKQIIKSSEASQHPVLIGEGDKLPAGDSRYVTQIIQPDSLQVGEIQSVVSTLASSDAKVIVWQPSNTLILTDTGPNIRKIQRILAQLDVAAPQSRVEIVPLEYAQATEVAQLIEELYGATEASTTPAPAETPAQRRRRRRSEPEPDPTPTAVSAGSEASYISKVIAEERTNSLIVRANKKGFQQIYDLLDDIDIDIDMSSRSQIHVVYLQHAKAEDVASVLATLSQSGSSSSSSSARRTTAPAARGRAAPAAEEADGAAEGSVLAAFDSGMRITHDESTNSLVIIASPEDFRVVESVITKLDIRRKQVYVDAVVLEVGSQTTDEFGVGYHAPMGVGDGNTGIISGQLGASSLGLTQDLLSGLALGVFGESIDVPFSSSAGTSLISVPAFGIVISALRSNQLVGIVSSPNLLTLDNEEAKIVVGREIPFPTSSGLNSLGQPVVSYQREDVATELTITPRINSSNEVTLEVKTSVQEIEDDNKGLDINQAGFITSKREIETTALVRNNQTMVLGGLVATTDTEIETKIPILGDLPVLGVLFRGKRKQSRRANLMIFLTPHIIETEEDMLEVQRIKEAQRQEFIRRFYGKSIDEQLREIRHLLAYSMNYVDEPSMYRGTVSLEGVEIDGEPLSPETRAVMEDTSHKVSNSPGSGAGDMDDRSEPDIVLPGDSDSTEPEATEPEGRGRRSWRDRRDEDDAPDAPPTDAPEEE